MFTRSGTAWSQEAKLVVSGGPTELGQWVAISGSTAVIGAPTYNSDAGTAYVFAGV